MGVFTVEWLGACRDFCRGWGWRGCLKKYVMYVWINGWGCSVVEGLIYSLLMEGRMGILGEFADCWVYHEKNKYKF